MGKPYYDLGYDWRKPRLYQQSVRELEQAGLDLVIIEDALSLGSDETLGLRVREAYGGPKLDPLLLAPYLFAATEHIGIAPTVNAGATPPYLAARQFATLHHLSSNRLGVNVVTDVKSARHFGLPEIAHDDAYARAEEWIDVVRGLWRSWEPGALVNDAVSGIYADPSKIRRDRFQGTYFDVAGPLNAPPFEAAEPTIISPGGSGPGLEFAGRNSDVQLALAPLNVGSVRAYREKIHQAARERGRRPEEIKILFVFRPEIVASAEEAERLISYSKNPSDADLRAVAAAHSSDLETDLTGLDLDKPIDPSVFGQHVSAGSIKRLIGSDPERARAPFRDILTRYQVKGSIATGKGSVGTVGQVADFIEELGEDADNDGFIFIGDLHPVSIHRTLDELAPELRRRGVLRREFGAGGLAQNLNDF